MVAKQKTPELPAVPWERIEQFVGKLTHDIRNGLNAFELQLTFLGEISTDPEAVAEIKRLRGTLADITRQLQAVRTASSATTPYPIEYPATDFFEDLRERYQKASPALTAASEWVINVTQDCVLHVDPELTITALRELLANADHFADQTLPRFSCIVTGGDTAVEFTLKEPRTALPGTALEDWGRTPLASTRRGAYGLGLFRARRILEAQGGGLKVSYSATQQLLETTATLPCTASPSP